MIAPTTDGRAEDHPPARPAAMPQPALSSDPPSPVPVVPSRTVDCWSCDEPNPPSRMFCASCGSFIAIGSRTAPTPESLPFTGPTPVPGDADADVSLPFVAGVAPLGSYSLEAQRRATRRTRTITAAASVVLAMVVGGAALYLASPLGERDGSVPQTAIVTAPTESPAATDHTSVVSGVSIEPEVALAPEVVAEPGSQPVAEVAEPEPLAEPELEPVVEPDEATQPAPIDEPEPAARPAPIVESRVEPTDAVPGQPAVLPEPVAEPVEAPGLAAAPDIVEAEPAGYDGGWVCGEDIVIEDSRVRDWSLGRVSFRVRNGFERVVFHLTRAGNGSGGPASIDADSMGSWKVKGAIPGAGRPGLGRRSVTLQLDGGFSGALALRGYRPSGLDTIKEFSVYPAGRDGRNVVISADTDGCYRVRVPAWSDPSGSVRRAEIHLDIKP